MRKLLAAVAVVALCGMTGTVLSAQRARSQAAQSSGTHFAPQVDFATDFDFGIGGRVEFDLARAVGAPMFGAASFDYFFPGAGVHVWEINADAWYNLRVSHTTLRPYVGGGLDIANYSCSGCLGFSATRAGLNIGGGTKFTMQHSKMTPYVEARVELRTGGEFVLTGGLLF